MSCYNIFSQLIQFDQSMDIILKYKISVGPKENLHAYTQLVAFQGVAYFS